jgi:malonate decarboxylase delta subunit
VKETIVEYLEYRFAAGRTLHEAQSQIVGVVASGNLEVLIGPMPLDGACVIDIRTPVRGFAEIWEAVVADFFARHPFADVRVSINDNGATPATVALRLDQAAQEYVAAIKGGPR